MRRTTPQPEDKGGPSSYGLLSAHKAPKLMVLEFFDSGRYEFRDMDRSDISRYVKTVVERGQSEPAAGLVSPSRYPGNSVFGEQGPVPSVPSNPNDSMRRFRQRQFQLHSRDIRQLDATISTNDEPTVIVRRHVILLRMDPFRAIVLRDRCLLLVPEGADGMLDKVMTRLQQPASGLDADRPISFEFRALESIMEQMCHQLRGEVEALGRWGEKVMGDLQEKGGGFKVLDDMRLLKNDVAALSSKVSSIQWCVRDNWLPVPVPPTVVVLQLCCL